jgi:hypothetical protein
LRENPSRQNLLRENPLSLRVPASAAVQAALYRVAHLACWRIAAPEHQKAQRVLAVAAGNRGTNGVVSDAREGLRAVAPFLV